jgi:hypothetical protein
LAQLVSSGIVKLRLPDQFVLYQEYVRRLFNEVGGLDDPRFNVLAESGELTLAMLVLAAGYVLIAAWVIWAWGAFADLNRLGRPRAVAALLLFLAAAYPVSLAFGYAQAGAGVSPF